ncbi:MAG: hypothetical protein KDA62_10415 [Planctomycetales bacterium]|nr:hypothetical protein [Planctomycetales bacterium]
MTPRDEFIDELLSAYLDGATSPDETARAERLLQSAEHRETLEQLRSQGQSLRNLPSFKLPSDFYQRVIAAGEVELGDRRRSRVAAQPAVSAAASNGKARWQAALIGLSSLAAAVALAFLAYDQFSNPSQPGPNIAHHEENQPAQLDPKVDEPSTPTNQTTDPDSREPASEVMLADGQPKIIESAGPPDSEPPVSPEQANADQIAATEVRPNSAATNVAEAQPIGPNVKVAQPARGLDATWPEAQQFIASATPEQPVDESTGLLFVVHVTLSPDGVRSGAFESVLRNHGIWLDNAIALDAHLEQSLLDGRFIAGDSQKRTETRDRVGLVYVEATGLQIDFASRELAASRGDVRRVQYDYTRKPIELQAFDQLHRDAVEMSAREAAMQAAAVIERGGPRMSPLPRGSARPILPTDLPPGATGFVGAFDEPAIVEGSPDAIPMMIEVAPPAEDAPFVPTIPVTVADEQQISRMNPLVQTLFVLKLTD